VGTEAKCLEQASEESQSILGFLSILSAPSKRFQFWPVAVVNAPWHFGAA